LKDTKTGTSPPKKWMWTVENDPNLDCEVDKYVEVVPHGLLYTGNCWHPNWGGGYTIGSQTTEEFLRDGPLNHQMPDNIAADIRAYLLEYPSGGTCRLELFVRLRQPERRWLARVDASMNGSYLTTRPETTQQASNRVFAGSIPVGKHTLGLAIMTAGEPPHVYHVPAREVNGKPEETLILECEPGDVWGEAFWVDA